MAAARPRGRAQGPRPRHPQGRARGDVPPGQARRLPGAGSVQERALPRRGRLRRRFRQAGPRPPLPGDPPAPRARSSTSRRPASTRSLERERPAADHRPRRRDRRQLRPREAPLPPGHHHDRRGRRRRPHPDPAPDLLLPPHAPGDRERLPLHRPAAALPGQHRASRRRTPPPRRSGMRRSASSTRRTSASSASRASAR